MTRFHFRRTRAVLMVAAVLVFGGPGTGARATESPAIDVVLDKAKVIRMPPHAETIVVGNPIIADVTTLKNNGLVVVTGKGFGETNLIFLDGTGNAIEETSVRVQASPSLLTVQRGFNHESYACQPRCEPTVSLGDSVDFLKDSSTQITSRNSLATPSTH